MQFSEIESRSRIIVIVTNGSDMQARFMTKVMRNNGDHLLAIPFRHKGLRINFEGKDVKIHMEVRDNAGTLWSFRGCRISAVKKDGLIYHKIVSGMSNGIENRRGGRRFHLWESGIFRISSLADPLFTNMKDIGPEGFSFVVDHKKKAEIKEGDQVEASIKNKDGDEMIVKGIIVRTEKMEKYMIYGCKMDSPSEAVLKFIKYLERKNTVVDVDFN